MEHEMAIDPVLKGTTFGAVLEAAERDEQLKRQRREEEKKGVQPQARLLAQALRGYVQQIDKASPLPMPPQLTELNEVSHMTQTSSEPLVLTTTQINILAAGYESSPFKTGPVGRAIGKLLDEKLIAPTEQKGWWVLTEAGKNAYEIHLAQLAAANDQVFKTTESEINLDDPALQRNVDPVVKRLQSMVEDRQQKVKDLNKSLDEMGRVADDQRARIKQLEETTDPATVEIIQTIRTWMAEDHEADKTAYLTILGYLGDLRSRATSIDWYAIVILPLIDFMRQSIDGDLTLEYIQDDPARIVRYVNTIRQSLAHMDNIADERTKIIEQHESTIESLRRCIEDLQETLNARTANARGHSALMLAETILDELCAQLPEVGAYRLAREQAVEAISILKAKRS
jgi:hypothetical protein